MTSNSSETDKIEIKYGCGSANRPWKCLTVPSYHSASGYIVYELTIQITVYHVCVLGPSCTPHFEIFGVYKWPQTRRKKWDRHEVRLWGCQPTIHTSYSTDISFGKWIYSLRDDNVDDCIPRLYFGSLLHPIFWGISGCLNDLKLVKNRWDRHEVRLSRCQSTIEMPYSTVISFGKHDMTLTLSFKLTSNTWTREWTS